MNTTYFFEKTELKDFLSVIQDLENQPPPAAGYVLRGFVLTPGNDPNSEELHFSPLYTSGGNEISGDNEIILTNATQKPTGCPYPPGYGKLRLDANAK